MNAITEVKPLRGEGETKTVTSIRTRRGCDDCGEPATKAHGYCYINGRSNPASSMYRRDDCSRCSDAISYACDEHSENVKRVCMPAGMDWGFTATASDQTAHLFLEWIDRP